MKVSLMYRDGDFDLSGQLPWNEQALVQDLELETLFNAMASGDEFLFAVARKAVLSSTTDLDTILYRQSIIKDCLKNPFIVRSIYDIAVEAIESKKKQYFGIFLNRFPEGILHTAINTLQSFMRLLKKLKNIADQYSDRFKSEGFTKFFAMLEQELSDEYFGCIQNHLRELKFRDGVLISAELGEGNKGTNYVLRKQLDKTQSWMERMLVRKPRVYTFSLHDRDESGFRAVSELKDRGINLVANALAQSADHILSFLTMLRTELAFYIGCLNLDGQLAEKCETSFPVPVAPGQRHHSFAGLYDVCLLLTTRQSVVSNDLHADDRGLVIITGANQGGKSSFLRSMGLSQLMMQCGMFVAAESFSVDVRTGIFTHYKREEDTTMRRGKFDEELSRMSDIADHVTPDSLILFNESFAATNEREGSEIARQIVCALVERGIKVFFVTHLYEFAHGFYAREGENAVFLRAERLADGTRTFKMREGEPLATGHGRDLYDQVFGGGTGVLGHPD